MFAHLRLGAAFLAVPLAMFMLVAPLRAAELDPSILDDVDLDDIEWLVDNNNPGNWYYILSGDPTGPGPWRILNKVDPNSFTQPHIHPVRRDIYVVDGTWWTGDGTIVDPDSATARPPGTFLPHYGEQVHWDGAKDEEVILLVGGDNGEGPETFTFVDVDDYDDDED